MRRILLIDHPVSQRRDRASKHLADEGHALTWCCPGRGEAIPDISGFDAMVLFGGAEMLSTDLEKPKTAYLRQELDLAARWLAEDKPFLGFCLGGQIMAAALGAEVAPHAEGLNQIGYYQIDPTEAGRDFLPEPIKMYQWHQEGFGLPQDATLLATDGDFPNQAIRRGKAFGLQFHPEVDASMYRHWIAEVPEALSRRGAQSVEQQMAESADRDLATAAWLDGFLDYWTRL